MGSDVRRCLVESPGRWAWRLLVAACRPNCGAASTDQHRWGTPLFGLHGWPGDRVASAARV